MEEDFVQFLLSYIDIYWHPNWNNIFIIRFKQFCIDYLEWWNIFFRVSLPNNRQKYIATIILKNYCCDICPALTPSTCQKYFRTEKVASQWPEAVTSSSISVSERQLDWQFSSFLNSGISWPVPTF